MTGPTTLPPGEARQLLTLLGWQLDELADAVRATGLGDDAVQDVMGLAATHARELATLLGAAPQDRPLHVPTD